VKTKAIVLAIPVRKLLEAALSWWPLSASWVWNWGCCAVF